MTDNEIEQYIEQIREMQRSARAAMAVADRMETLLKAAGVQVTHYMTHSSWKRTRAADEVNERE